MNKEASNGCFGVTAVLAAIVSAVLNHSFWWAVLHFFCGFLYLIYVICCRSHEVIPAFKAAFN